MADTKKKEEIVAQGNANAKLIVNNAFVDGLVSQLAEKEKFGLTFPKDYNYSNELMGAYLILKETQDKDGQSVLQTCSQTSIANTLMDMVTMGVSMQKKQCYPVAYKGKLQCQMSVYGNTCIARRYGLENISAVCIYEGDDFEYHIEDAEIVIDKHTQNFLNIDNDKIIGAYAIAKMADGTKHVELMNMNMIKKSWSQGFGYKEGSGVHEKFKDQMAVKTVKNRCLKYIIRTFGTQAVSDYMDKAEEFETEDVVAGSVEYDVEQNMATEDFMPEPTPKVEKVEAEVVNDAELPDFMKVD